MRFAEILLILVAVVILFGLGRLPKAMGDLGRGIKAFKTGLRGEEEDEAAKKDPARLASPEEKDSTSKKV
ncbi:MAG: twin-arginine translocase TatA/TatE family subunit [Holosporales bacterium]|jgi:sec-independent protein translocase protein TatA